MKQEFSHPWLRAHMCYICLTLQGIVEGPGKFLKDFFLTIASETEAPKGCDRLKDGKLCEEGCQGLDGDTQDARAMETQASNDVSIEQGEVLLDTVETHGNIIRYDHGFMDDGAVCQICGEKMTDPIE